MKGCTTLARVYYYRMAPIYCQTDSIRLIDARFQERIWMQISQTKTEKSEIPEKDQ